MKRLCSALLILCLALSLCPAALAGDPYSSVLLNGKDGMVTIYTKASTGSTPVGRFYNGLRLTYDTREYTLKSKWIKVNMNDPLVPVEGFVRQSDVADGYTETSHHVFKLNTSIPQALPYAVTSGDIALYDGTGKKAEVVGRLPGGVSMVVLGEKNDFYYASVAGVGTRGFVPKASLGMTGDKGAPDVALPTGEKGRVYASKEPDQNSVAVYSSCAKTDMLWQYADGSAVAVHQRLGDWALISLLNVSGYTMSTGFIESRFLDENADHSLPVLYVRTDEITNRLLMRYANHQDSDYFAKFFPGVRATVLAGKENGTNDDYSYVRVGNITGYFKNEFLLSSAINPPRYALVSEDVDEYMPNYYEYVKQGVRFAKGDRVTLLGSRDAGIYVETADGRYAYAPIECLTPADDAYVFTAKVSASSLKMRGAADEDGDVLRTLSKGVSVKVLVHGDVWSKIEYKNEIGYVMTRYLKY